MTLTPPEAAPSLPELRALAMDATPGPWMLATSNSWRRFITREGKSVCEPIKQNDGHPDLYFRNGGADGPDAAFIAAANPAAVLALCDRVERLESALRVLMREAVVLSRDYLSAFEQWPLDATIQGWDKARWLRAADAHDEAQEALK